MGDGNERIVIDPSRRFRTFYDPGSRSARIVSDFVGESASPSHFGDVLLVSSGGSLADIEAANVAESPRGEVVAARVATAPLSVVAHIAEPATVCVFGTGLSITFRVGAGELVAIGNSGLMARIDQDGLLELIGIDVVHDSDGTEEKRWLDLAEMRLGIPGAADE